MTLNVPKVLIGVSAVVGLAVNGVPGALVGGAVGLGLVYANGAVLTRANGGVIPRALRRSVAVNTLVNHPEAVAQAFPCTSGQALLARLEAAIEVVCHHALVSGPPGSELSAGSVDAAFQYVSLRQPTWPLTHLHHCLREEFAQELVRSFFGAETRASAA